MRPGLAPWGAPILCCGLFACDRAGASSDAETSVVPPPTRASASAQASASSSPSSSSAAQAGRPALLASRPVTLLAAPSTDARAVGRLDLGASVVPSATVAAGDARCAAGFLAVGSGFVCDDGALVAEAADERAAFVSAHLGAPGAPYPVSYGESLGTVIYDRVPDVGTQQRGEPGLEAQRALLRAARRAALLGKDDEIPPGLRGVDLTSPADPCPELLRRGAARVVGPLVRGAEMGWIAECEAEERTWLVTPDLTLVPRDRVARLVASATHGAETPAPPVGPCAAFVVGKARPRYRMVRYGFFGVVDGPLPVDSLVWLTGQSRTIAPFTYLETTSDGEHVLAEHVVRVTKAARPSSVGPGERWLDVQASRGLLVAYEGDAPVYATLAGAPPPLIDDGPTHVAARGRFRVEAKERLRTFGEGARLRRDLPHVQLLGGQLWLVGDPFPASVGAGVAGSIRVSPIDAAWLYRFTTPRDQAGWSRVESDPQTPGTLVQIRD